MAGKRSLLLLPPPPLKQIFTNIHFFPHPYPSYKKICILSCNHNIFLFLHKSSWNCFWWWGIASTAPMITWPISRYMYFVFIVGVCDDDVTELRCNNGKCVPRSVSCDLANNCGDNSDQLISAPAYCSGKNHIKS